MVCCMTKLNLIKRFNWNPRILTSAEVNLSFHKLHSLLLISKLCFGEWRRSWGVGLSLQEQVKSCFYANDHLQRIVCLNWKLAEFLSRNETSKMKNCYSYLYDVHISWGDMTKLGSGDMLVAIPLCKYIVIGLFVHIFCVNISRLSKARVSLLTVICI